MKIVDGRSGGKKATHTEGLTDHLPGLPRSHVSLLLATGNVFSHTEEAGFVDGIRGRLVKSDAFRGISESMAENGGTYLSPDAAKSVSRYLVPVQIFLTKLLKNEVPAQDVTAAGGLRR